MTTTSWTEEIHHVAGTSLQLIKGGSGAPLLILHDELGHPGWLRYHTALAQHYTLYIPSHPGYGRSERLEWIADIRDLAAWYLDALDELGLDRLPLLGLGLGGWLAAEMASMCPQQFTRLVVVDAMGIKPPQGEIYDIFLVVARQYFAACVLNPQQTPEYQQLYGTDPTPEQAELWEIAREESSRLGWRPYMHSPSLPSRLRRLRRLPTLVVWGQQDAIVPVSAAAAYHAAIPGSQLVVLDQCGHRPEMEQTDEFVRVVGNFLRAA
jgi:pimeloyl-ACP methyl ester carboxylesterase